MGPRPNWTMGPRPAPLVAGARGPRFSTTSLLLSLLFLLCADCTSSALIVTHSDNSLRSFKRPYRGSNEIFQPQIHRGPTSCCRPNSCCSSTPKWTTLEHLLSPSPESTSRSSPLQHLDSWPPSKMPFATHATLRQARRPHSSPVESTSPPRAVSPSAGSASALHEGRFKRLLGRKGQEELDFGCAGDETPEQGGWAAYSMADKVSFLLELGREGAVGRRRIVGASS